MAIAWVQRAAPNGATAANATTLTTVAAAHAAGHFVVGRIIYQDPATITSVTDTAGNTWYRAVNGSVSGNNRMDIWYAYNIVGHASNVVTVAVGNGGTTYGSISVQEFSGVGTTADPLDTTVTNITGNSTSISSGTVTVTGSQDVIYAAMVANSAGLVAGTGYVLNDENVIGDSVKYFGDEYHIVTASEAATATCTSAAWGVCAASFKGAPTTQIAYPISDISAGSWTAVA